MRRVLIATVAIGVFGFGPSARPAGEEDEPRPIRDLTQALTHASSPEPKECIRGLKAIPQFAPAKRNEEVAAVLKRALRSDNAEVRVVACQVTAELCRLAPEYRSVRPFAEMLNSSDKAIRMAALENLGPGWGGSSYSQQELDALIRLLKDKDPKVRFLVYGHLGTAGDQACLRMSGDIVMFASNAIIENLETESAEGDPAKEVNMLYYAVRALGKVGKRSPKAVPALLKVYDRFSADTKRDANIRWVVVQALAEIGPFSDKSLPFLAKLMRNEKLPLQERTWAARAIGQFGPLAADLVPDMIALLRLELKQPDPPRGLGGRIIAAFVLLGETAEPVVPLLLELAQGDENAEVTEYAIRALGDLAPIAAKQAAPILGKLCFAKNPKNWHQLKLALARCGEHGVKVALDALKGNDVAQQQQAIWVLQEMGPDARPAIPELKRIADDDKHRLQVDAKAALQLLNR